MVSSETAPTAAPAPAPTTAPTGPPTIAPVVAPAAAPVPVRVAHADIPNATASIAAPAIIFVRMKLFSCGKHLVPHKLPQAGRSSGLDAVTAPHARQRVEETLYARRMGYG